MVSSSVPSPITYEPPAPRRETMRRTENSDFAQSLAGVSAYQSEQAPKAKDVDALTEPARPPKRPETMRPARDDHKFDATKPAAKTNTKPDGNFKTPSEHDQDIVVPRDEPNAGTTISRDADNSVADAKITFAEDQSALPEKTNRDKTEDINPPIDAAFVTPPSHSPDARSSPEKKEAETNLSHLTHDVKPKTNLTFGTSISHAELNNKENEITKEISFLNELEGHNPEVEHVFFENKAQASKILNYPTIDEANETLWVLASSNYQQDKVEMVNDVTSINAVPDHDKDGMNTTSLKSFSAINSAPLTSEREDTSSILTNLEQETKFDPLGPANFDLTIDKYTAPQAPFLSTSHSTTPLLTAHAPPIMASGRIVYSSLPYSKVPMEIGLSALEGQRSIQVRLSPADLGTIDIELDVSDQSEARAHISADDPRTLAMLKQDATVIRQALEQTGLSTHADSLNFSLRQDGQSGARQNPNDQRVPSSTSTKTSDNSSPPNTPLPPTPMKRVNSLLDVNI